MKIKTITTLMMLCGSAAWAQNSIPASPIIANAPAVEGKAKAPSMLENASIKTQIEQICSQSDKRASEFSQKIRAEKDRKKQREMFNKRPTSVDAVNQIIAIAEKSPKAEGVEEGLAWAAQRSTPAQRKQVTALLFTHHSDGEALGALVKSYMRMRGPQGLTELKEIREKSTNDSVKIMASYAVAEKLLSKANTKKEGIKLLKELKNTPNIAELSPKVLKQVETKLFISENLSVGCAAPDIVGTDHEDKEFKLSDYKGKVVLLDFWGIW